ncbi:MAG: PAS domain S-box protein [Acidobacteria bacterium]|nr:MAG: PAS domain S-box protein [Acidobacteriota bacterium]
MESPTTAQQSDTRIIRPAGYGSPVRLLVIVIVSVFAAETMIMALLFALSPIPESIAVWLDSLLLVVLVFPALFFFVLRPLRIHIAERNKLLDRLFSITHLLLAYMDPQFNFIRVNSAYAEADGKTPDQLIGKNHFELFPHAENEKIFRQVVETGEPYFAHAKPFAYAHAPERGVSYWDWTLIPLKDSAGRVEALILSLVDVTERKKAEMALTENEMLLRKVLDTLPVGVWVVNRVGDIVQANPASIDIWGNLRSVDIKDFGQYKGVWAGCAKATEAAEWSAARAILDGETTLGEEIEIEAFDGTQKIILNSAVPLTTGGGEVIGAIVISEDITARKRNECEIRQRNRELATLNAISTAASSSLETTQVVSSLEDLLTRHAGFAAGAIYTLEAAEQKLQLELSWGIDKNERPRGSRVPIESYPFRQALLEKKVRVFSSEQTDNIREGAELVPALAAGPQGSVCVPLIAHGEVQGLMELASNNSGPDSESFSLLQAIGQIMGIAIHNTRLFAREQKARWTAEVLREAGLALTQSLDMKTVMEALLDFTARLVPYDSASVILLEDEDHLAIHAARGCNCQSQLGAGGRRSVERRKNDPIEEVIASRCGKVISLVSPEAASSLTPCHVGTRSWLGVPFVARENVIGLFSLGKIQPGFYGAEQVQLAEALASQAAAAVQNSWLFTQLRSNRERLQTLSRQLVEVQENERAYVARELHDEAGQVLTSLMVGLRLLERDAGNPTELGAGIARLKGMVDDVLEDLHRLAVNLRPASLDHLGLEAALKQHLETIADRNEITVQIETVGMDVRLPKDMEVALYRIVQEALANVVRHARATRVDVLIKRRAGKVIAVVEDNGIGFNEKVALNSGRLGLFGMRERAEMLGGSLTIECGPSGGTTLLVEVPYGDSNPDCR